MSETPPHSPEESQPQPAPRKRNRRWLKVVGVLFVLLILLIVLLPTIASTGFVRGRVLGIVNDSLNGKLDISDWSIGWTSGVKAKGIRVVDTQGGELFAGEATTEVSLLKAITGTIDLGKTELKGKFHIKVDENGKTNLDDLVKPSDTQPTEGPTSIPNIQGQVLAQIEGQIDQAGAPTVYVQTAKVTADIQDINKPISPQMLLEMRVGDGPVGKVTVDATVDAVENNQLNLEKLAADAKVNISGIDLSAANPFLASAQTVLAGVANGAITVKTEGLTRPFAEGQIDVTGLAVSGDALKGDRLDLGKLSIPIKVIADATDPANARIKIEKLRAEIPQGFIDIAGDFTQKSLEKLGANEAPGENGWFSATVALTDAAALVKQLPNTLPLQQGASVTSGKFSAVTNITLRPGDVVQKTRIDLQAAGTNSGKPIAIEPISISLDSTYLPKTDMLKGLKDIALVLKSDFAGIAGGGASLSKLQLNGKFDLARLREQLAQFVDLQQTSFSGTGDFSIATTGDVSSPGGILKANVVMNINGINVTLPDVPPLKYEKVTLGANADVIADANSIVRAIQTASVSFQTVEGGMPIIELAGSVNGVDLQTQSVQRFELSKLTVSDLAKAQTQADPFLPASFHDLGIRIVAGQVYSNVMGSFDGKMRTVRLEKPLEVSLPGLEINKTEPSGKVIKLLQKEKLYFAAQGNVSLPADGSIGANLTTLNLNSSSKLFALSKGDGELILKQASNGAISGKGTINLAANLKTLSDLLAAVSGTTSDQLRSGLLTAVLSLNKADSPQTVLKLDGTISDLSVATIDPRTPIEKETIQLAVSAISPDDLSGIKDLNVSLNGAWLSAAIKKGQVNLSGSTWDMLQSAEITVSSPDLGKVQQVVNALLPPAAAKATEGEPVLEPLMVHSGRMDIAASVMRDAAKQTTSIRVPTMTIANLALMRGPQSYAFDQSKPISFVFNADLVTAGEAVRSLNVTELKGDLQVAQLGMSEPISITDLSSATPSARGTVTLDAPLEKLTPLLAVLQGGEQLPYLGNLALVQKLSTQSDVISLQGGIKVVDFKVLDATDRRTAVFTEPQITIDNAISVNLTSSDATIQKLVFDMVQSKAVGMAVRGGVRDWAVQRQLQDVKLDLSYDLEKIWPIVKPMLAPETQQELKDLKVSGKYTKPFHLRGSFPANDAKGRTLAFNESIKFLAGDGSISVDLLDAMGLNIQKLEIPILLEKGQVAILTTDRKRPAPAACNGGTLDLGEITIDLSADEPRAWMAKNQKLLRNVTINPLLGDSLGKYVNPVFANSQRAAGLLDVTVEYCKGVALLEKWQTEQSGSARIVFSLSDMDIANPLGSMMLGQLGSVSGIAKFSKEQADTFKGQIKDAVVTLDKGRTTQDVTLSLTAVDPTTVKPGETPRTTVLPLGFQGNIRLNDLSQNLNVSIPTALLVGLGNTSDLAKVMSQAFPSGIPISLKGTTVAPKVDLGNFAQRFMEGQIKSGLTGQGGLLDNLLGGKRKDSRDGEKSETETKKK